MKVINAKFIILRIIVCLIFLLNNTACYALAPGSKLISEGDNRSQLSVEFLIQYLLNKIKMIRKEGPRKEYEIRLRLGKYLYELNEDQGTRVEMLESENWLNDFGDLYVFKVRGETLSFFAVKGTDDVFYFPGGARTLGDVHAVMFSALRSGPREVREKAFISLAGSRAGRDVLIKKVFEDEGLFAELYSLPDEWIAQTLGIWERVYIFLKYVAGLSSSKPEADRFLIREFMDKMFESGALESDVRAITASIKGKYGDNSESLSEYLMYSRGYGKSRLRPVKFPKNVIRDMLGELSRFDLRRAVKLDELYVSRLEDGEIASQIDVYVPKTYAVGKPVAVKKARRDMAAKVNILFEECRDLLSVLVDVRREIKNIKAADPYDLDIETRERFYDFRKFYHGTISIIEDLDLVMDLRVVVLSLVKPLIILSGVFMAGSLVSLLFSTPQLSAAAVMFGAVYVLTFNFNEFWAGLRTMLHDMFILPENSIPEMLLRAHMFLSPKSISDAEPEISLIKRIVYEEPPDFKKFYRRYYDLIFAEHKKIHEFNSTEPNPNVSAIDYIMRTFVSAPRTYRIAVRNLLSEDDDEVSEKDINLSIDFLYSQAKMGSLWALKLLRELMEHPDINDDTKIKLANDLFKIRSSKEFYLRLTAQESLLTQVNSLDSSL
ncbi:hypothetical protein ACFLQ8_00965 [Candidatus Auribacterota bacterium]